VSTGTTRPHKPGGMLGVLCKLLSLGVITEGGAVASFRCLNPELQGSLAPSRSSEMYLWIPFGLSWSQNSLPVLLLFLQFQLKIWGSPSSRVARCLAPGSPVHRVRLGTDRELAKRNPVARPAGHESRASAPQAWRPPPLAKGAIRVLSFHSNLHPSYRERRLSRPPENSELTRLEIAWWGAGPGLVSGSPRWGGKAEREAGPPHSSTGAGRCLA
jgi:hypothetical protein